MLEKPKLDDAKIVACLWENYGLRVSHVAFLPLGADVNTAVYRASAHDDTPYFVKLRSGVFDETSVTVPKLLSEQGIRHIIVPIATQAGQLWARLDDYTVILYPFVESHDGGQVQMTDRQWVEFGVALKAIHTVNVPPALARQLQRESYSPTWREMVKMFQARVERETFADPIAAQAAELLRSKRREADYLVERAEQLAFTLQAEPRALALCHSDIHAWNLLISSETFYVVDWDNPILAPKERDLMFVGSGMSICDTPQQKALFDEGYGKTEVDLIALVYYRFERIVQDIAAYAEQLLLSEGENADSEDGLRRLANQFEPNPVTEAAYKAEQLLLAQQKRVPIIRI